MSYSFSLVGRDKADAKKQAEEKMAEIVNGQPNHSHDRDTVMRAVGACIDLIDDRSLEKGAVHLSVSGSVGWNVVDNEPIYNGVGLNVSARAVPL